MNGQRTADLAGTRALILHEQLHIETYLQRETVAVPPGRRVWMVGPHPDDNVLGPGGTAVKYVQAGIPVRWMCLTDGRACSPDPAERERMARVRSEEERACARLLGIEEPELLGIPEDQLTQPAASEHATRRILAALETFRPDALFVPWILEMHPLHRYTNVLVARALQSFPQECTLYSWAAASFPPPRYVVDIGPVYERKLELMRTYASQLEFRDYVSDCELLGALHGSHGRPPLPRGEAFFARSRQQYVDDVLARGLDHPDTLGCGAQPLVPESPS